MKRYELVLERRCASLRPGQHDRRALEASSTTPWRREGLYPKGLDYNKAYDLQLSCARTLQNFQ